MVRIKSYFTLLEIMVALVIIGTMILGVIQFMSAQVRYKEDNVDKKFCLLKANQILNELRTYMENTGATSGVADTLDRLSSATPNPLLTLIPMPTSDTNDFSIVMSNNTEMHPGDHLSRWKYLRTIAIAPIGIGGTRQVTVKIYRGRDFKDFPASNLVDPLNGYYPNPIISLITVLPTIGDVDYVAQQVYDFYNIAIENIPSYWVHMGQLLTTARGALDYVDNANDGLTIRNHWVTKLGYGRDRYYSPFLNVVNDTYQAVDNAYFYPGKLPSGFATTEYYVPTLLKCHMQSDANSPTTSISYINGYNPYFTSEMLTIDPTVTISSWNSYNPMPYAPADYLNNPMRYPDTKKIFDIRNYEAKRAWYHKNIDRNPEKNPGLEEISREDNADFANVEDYFTRVGQGEEMPWSLLLDELSMNPEKFRNAIFSNLHGELLPMPPTRNYSDAAFSSTGKNIKRPVAGETGYDAGQYDYFRVVAHPEKIRYHAKEASSFISPATDETTNIDTQNPFYRVYGYLSEPIRSGAWRSAGTNNADGLSGIKKARLDDNEESPISISIRFHNSKFEPGQTNDDFNYWRELLVNTASLMRSDRYVSFFEGGVNDLNDKPVYYGTNYASSSWTSGVLTVPTESNEGWGYLNHALDPTDANVLKSISSDGFRAKGLGVEPLGLKYAPYFYLDYSLDPTKTQWDNVMYFHQKSTRKINYNSTDDTNADSVDLGLNVDYIVGATSVSNSSIVANNIIKAAGDFTPAVGSTISGDIYSSGFNIARQTNPVGWTPHFIGVSQSFTLPATEPARGATEWYALQSNAGVITSVSSNGSGVMRFWTGSNYDDSVASYHSFPRRNLLRLLNFQSTDSLLGETSASYWNFALIGPDPISAKYEMLYLSDKNWVPFSSALNLANSKVAWDDSMSWSLSGGIYIDLNATKTTATILAMYTGIVGKGKYLITNITDDATIADYYMMTTVIPGESSGAAFVPAKGMIISDKKVTAVSSELDPNDPAITASFKNTGLAGVRYFKISLSGTLGAIGTNTTSVLVIPKAGICENVTVTGTTISATTAFYKPAVGMKVYNASGGEVTTITAVQSYVEPTISIGTFATSPVSSVQFTVKTAFTGPTTKLYLVAVPAIQSTVISNEPQPSVITNPRKRGLTVYADSKTQLDSFAASDIAGNANYVKYGLVTAPTTTDPSSATTLIYRRNLTGGVGSWVQTGSLGRKLSYSASDSHWNKIPFYDKMWAEIEYAFIHTPKQSNWLPKEMIGSDQTFVGDHCIIITLHNTPMTTPSETSSTVNSLLSGLTVKNTLSGGLLRAITPSTFTNDRRLYQLEYIPCAVRDSHKPTGGDTSVSTTTLDLLCNDNKAKNTARWRIKFPSRTQMERARTAGVSASKNIPLSAGAITYFGSSVGLQQIKDAYKPLNVETRIGGITTAEWSNIGGSNLNVVVGSNTGLVGVGAPSSVTVKNGYFLDVSKDIADWSMWGRVSVADTFNYEDCRTHNNSRSFAWVVDNIAEYPNLNDDIRIPFSEKSQTFGDARHMPYVDSKDNFTGTNYGYNWYFASSTSTNNWSDYTGFGKIKSSYGTGGGGPIEADVPKLFMWLREGLNHANAIWTSVMGYSNYYIGLGNEIGYGSAQGFSSSIPLHQKPWGVNSNGYEQTVTGSIISIKNKTSTWEARHFLGELFPEWEYDNFTKDDSSTTSGTLKTGYNSVDTEYQRFDREGSKYLEIKNLNCMRQTETEGCTSFFNIESSTSKKFNHTTQATSNDGTIVTNKKDMILDAFHISVDASTQATKPWIITESSNTPHEWTDYSIWRNEGLLVDNTTTSAADKLMDMVLYRDKSDRIASGVLEIHDKGATSARGTRKRSLFVVNGLSNMATSGANSISTYSVMSMLYAHLRGGSKWLSTNIAPASGSTLVVKDDEPSFVRQLPLINIISPKINYPITGTNCQINWTVQWRRWDGKPYWGNNGSTTDVDYWKTEYAEPKPDGSIFFRVIYSEAPHSNLNDWRYVSKPDIKTSAGLTYDKIIDEKTTYAGSDLDVVEIDGDEVYANNTQPGRVIPAGTDSSPWKYQLDWTISSLKTKTSYAFRVECHRRQHTIYYLDSTGVEKAYENDANAINSAKNQRKYLQAHYSFQQGLMIREQ